MAFARLSGFVLFAVAAAVAVPSAIAASSSPAPRTEIPRPMPQSGNAKQQAAASDFDKAEYLIKADKCEEAIPLLLNVVADNGRDADALNYLGYCHRKLGKYPESLGFYKRALAVNPKHKGANEYLGELYLRMNDLAKAEEQHTILKGLCPSGCEELEDLEADIADFKANGNKWPG
ncbi:MAG: tetratricopeptide repeat protein [Micropepsaceae bacterium]